MQFSLSHPYPTPPIPIPEQQNFSLVVQLMSFGHDNVDYNASYGIPPRIPHITNVPMASGESSSSIPLVTQFPVGPEIILVSNKDPSST
jgi:hypothetical protein